MEQSCLKPTNILTRSSKILENNKDFYLESSSWPKFSLMWVTIYQLMGILHWQVTIRASKTPIS